MYLFWATKKQNLTFTPLPQKTISGLDIDGTSKFSPANIFSIGRTLRKQPLIERHHSAIKVV